MCEIEHFVDPSNKKHPKFGRVANIEMDLFSACNQIDGKGAEKVHTYSIYWCHHYAKSDDNWRSSGKGHS